MPITRAMTKPSTKAVVTIVSTCWVVVMAYTTYLWVAGPFAGNHYLEFQSTADFLVVNFGLAVTVALPLALLAPLSVEYCRATRVVAFVSVPTFAYLAWSRMMFLD